MGKVSVAFKDDKAFLYTPYNQDFVREIKNIGGAKWDGCEKAWAIPKASIVHGRELMERYFGESDVSVGENVDVRLTVTRDHYEDRTGITAFGKTLARAFGRDSGARVGEDVELMSGQIGSGGSRANWESQVDEGSVFILHSVSLALVENGKEDWFEYEIIKKVSDRKDELIREKKKLLARVAEIDAELEDMK